MSQKRDSSDASSSDDALNGSSTTGTWSPNGSGATPSAVAEAPAVDTDTEASAGSDPATSDLAPADADLAPATSDLAPADAEAGAESDSAAASDAASAIADPADPIDDGSAFLADLTRAMQATAGAERERVVADIDRRREKHLAGIDARRTEETDRMRKFADGDLEAIDTWADGERQRIDSEREARAAALRDDLEKSLTEHSSKIDREIEGVEAAIVAHRSDIDAFFATLDRETDPVAIAQQASRRPAFPALESITVDPTPESSEAASTPEPAAESAPVAGPNDANPTADDAADAPGLGVMDRGLTPKLADAWAAWSDPKDQSVSTDPTAATGGDDAGPEPVEVVAVTSTATHAPTDGVLQSTPVSRPMSWLRRSAPNDHTNEDS